MELDLRVERVKRRRKTVFGSLKGMCKGPEVEERIDKPRRARAERWRPSVVPRTPGVQWAWHRGRGRDRGRGRETSKGWQEAGPSGRASGPPRFSFILRAIGNL